MPNAKKSYASPPVFFMSHQEPIPISARDWFCDVKGTPLFELLSVKVYNNSFKEILDRSGRPHVEIFGSILLDDGRGNKFPLFRRKRSEAKIVFLRGTKDNTSVILQNYDLQRPRCLPSKFWLIFSLRDRYRNIVIVEDRKLIDCTGVVAYDEVQNLCFFREEFVKPLDSSLLLTACADFVLFHCALLASVSIVVERNDISDGSDFLHAEVFGSITASTEMRDKTHIKRSLYDESQKLVFGALNELSTFAVPCYSLLEFLADLEVEGDKFIASLKYEPTDWFCMPFAGKIIREKCCIRVFVQWRHASKVLPEYAIYDYHDSQRLPKEGFGDLLQQFLPERKRRKGRNIKRDQLCHVQPQLEALSYIKWDISEDPVALMEIFSISICSYGGDGRLLGLKGKICATDEDEELVIFDEDNGSLILRSYETIKLKAPQRCHRGDNFCIALNLKDGQGNKISTGSAGFSNSQVHCFFNRRICSIVRGQHGFAALHYTIFADAVQAKLRFTLKHCSPEKDAVDNQYVVYGRINARYTNCTYLSHYEKKYYQSTLLEKSKVVVPVDGVIPLSKSVVAVPLNASLVVLGKVHVLFQDQRLETLKYEQTFNPVDLPFDYFDEKSEIVSDKSQGSNFLLQVSLEWTRFPIYA